MKRFPPSALALLLGLLLAVPAGTARAVDVGAIEVRDPDGNVLDKKIVLAYTTLREGDEFSRRVVARDVKALEKSRRFSTVSVKVEPGLDAVTVVYEVQLRPRLRAFNITGNEAYSVSRLRGLTDLIRGDPVDDRVLSVEIQKIKDYYRKKNFPFAEISWRIDPVPTTGEADVFLRIKEGKRARVSDISFEGGKGLHPKQLRKAMVLKESNFLSFLTKAGTYDPNQLDLDVEAIRAEFLNAGYLDVNVGQPEVTTVRPGRLKIRIPIEQGEVYTVRDVTVSGVTLFPQEEVEAVVTIRPGEVASLAALKQSAQNLRDYYGSRGYLRTGVRTLPKSFPVEREVSITFDIREGELSYIRDISIHGNTRTKDKVIRRELAVYPGEIYDQVRVRRSERRLRNLGYFSTVLARPIPVSDDEPYYDLDFVVEEQKTGQFVVGAGFSSIDDLIGFVELSQGNFDLTGWPHFTGGGQKIKVRAQLGSSRNDLDFSFTEPWFLNQRLSLSLGAFRSDRRFLSDDYEQINTGGSVSLAKALTGFNRIRLRYSLEEIQVTDIDDDASDLIKQEEGTRLKSALKLEHIFDSRDSVFIPTRGNRTSVAGTVAGGPLGADTDIYRLDFSSSQYFPLFFDHVFSLRARVATVEEYGDSERVPIFDRLFLGGARTLRGFDFRDVGPKDETGEPIGGRTSWFASAEYTVPVVPSVRFATFYDIGQVSSEAFDLEFSEYNSDFGIGVRFDIPQLPLRLDYGWPLEADEFNDRSSGRFNFLIGYTF